MRLALGLARRGLGNVAPNPSVGCLLVANGRVLARGWTQAGGRPHAEVIALERAGEAARGATAYVSLEPCAHHGKTGPCAEALAKAGIARCVIAVEDPDPRVSGKGVTLLRNAGIETDVGLLGIEARALNAGFFSRIEHGRPLIALKLASTLDGRIATHRGESRWITGEAARAQAHFLRARFDAVAVGSGTAVADNPRLDVRLPGFSNAQPLRIVFDGRLRLPLTHDLVTRAKDQSTWLVTRRGNPPARIKAFEQAGVEVIKVESDRDGNLDLQKTFGELGRRGLTRVLVEGGGHVAAALIRTDLVDEIYWFRAPKLIGGDGLPAVASYGLDRLADSPEYERVEDGKAGPDAIEHYRRIRHFSS